MTPRAPRLRAGLAGLATAAVTTAGGLGLVAVTQAGPGPSPAVAAATPEAPTRPVTVPEPRSAPGVPGPAAATEAPAAAPVADPVAVVLPRLGIRSELDRLGLQPDGVLEAPPRWDVAGWYAAGPRPGEQGPAVIAGHVDGPDGPAVFWRLQELRVGDRVDVVRADGTTAAFAVTRTLVTAKDGFPTAEVYGPRPDAELRLITCEGLFDRRTGHYVDNLVVFATEVLA